ncbi:phage tail protein [Xenorhabdus szentirmaii]|nr:phage tail protein [Xenorhabdus szentirmaii]PHM43062.1 phage tail protein [Xenorhabdus szentirmaii]
MSTKYFALLTQLGADKLANAAALGTKLAITQMAVGDGGGVLPTPDTTQTKLVNERRRATINTLNVDPKNAHQIIAEQVIPESEGGWWIREIGLFDQDGVLIAVGNCPETYKPQLQEGSGRTQTIRMVLIVSHTDAVTLKIDPSVVLATREYTDATVKKAITEHEKSRRHPDATLKEKGFVVLNSAVDSNSEAQAATPKAVKAAYDLAKTANNSASNCLEKVKNGADIQNKQTFVENLGLSKTVDQAENALPVTSKLHATVGGLTVVPGKTGSPWPQMLLVSKEDSSVGIEGVAGERLTIFSDKRGERRYTLGVPESTGYLGMQNTANISKGWWKCGDTGLIIQWGVAYSGISSTPGHENWYQSRSTFDFPIQFPNKCLSLTNSISDGGTGNQWILFAHTLVINQIRAELLIQSRFTFQRPAIVSYIAIGY